MIPELVTAQRPTVLRHTHIYTNPKLMLSKGWLEAGDITQLVKGLPHNPEDLGHDLQGKGGCGSMCFGVETFLKLPAQPAWMN